MTAEPLLADEARRTDGIGEEVEVVIVGAGQAGLGIGYLLSRQTSPTFTILDGASRIGQSWRERWDSLSLFTPRRFSSLPGMPFPLGLQEYPTKDEVADYLERYATRFDLPVALSQQVDRVERHDGWMVARTPQGVVRSRHLVVATGPFRGAFMPDAAKGLDPCVRQLHSSTYRRPADVPTPDVLVVGGGNSAAQLACELADTHRVTMASPHPLWFLPRNVLGVNLYSWLSGTGVLTASANARVSRYVRSRGDAIIGRELAKRIKTKQVRFLPHRVVDAHGTNVVLADGTCLEVSAVLWCTGFRPDYHWLRVPGALDAAGGPVHTAGKSPVPGIHWMGLPWQTRLNSSLINGVAHDAQTTVDRLAG